MIIKNGIISDKIDQRDFEFAGDINELNLPAPKNILKKVWYNQNEVSSMSCTLHASLGAFTDLTGYKFSLEERKKLWEEAKKQGASDNFGWYMSDAVNLVRKYVNTLGLGTFISIRTAFGSDVFYKAIKQGYSAIGMYSGNKLYNEDIADDGIVECTNLAGASTYSHCIRYVWGTGVEVRDNYLGSKTWVNEYRIEKEVELYKNGVIGSSAYFLVEDSPALPIDRKLVERLNNRVVYNNELQAFAIIKNGVATKLKGKDMSELFAFKWSTTNESYVLGLDKTNWSKIGLN
jgi:hypothetical protein